MRWFGTHNKTKGILTDDRDIQQFQLAREEDAQRKGEQIRELELSLSSVYNLVDLWLLCHPDAEEAAVIYDRMSEFAEQHAPPVSHDEIISWLATAIRCLPSNLVPRGEGVTIREKMTLPMDPRICDWNHHTGGTQVCLLMQFLSKCSLQLLDVDERANVMFAVLRIFTDSPEVAESPLVEPFVRNLHPADTRVEFLEALAAIYFQISASDDVATMAEGIRHLYRILDDEPLVLRLTVEILMCLCQRSEVAGTLPDFRMGDQMYCNQVKVIILDLTSDAHEQVPEAYQKDELSTLVNEVFNLKKRQPDC